MPEKDTEITRIDELEEELNDAEENARQRSSDPTAQAALNSKRAEYAEEYQKNIDNAANSGEDE